MASYKQYRAPQSDDTALVDPAWSDQVRQLRDQPQIANIAIGGRPLAELRAAARRELVAIATEHTGAYANVESDAVGRLSSGAPLVVSGHQPELFHPGVWFKNFALNTLAQSAGGVGVHVLIDSDLAREPSVRAPTGDLRSPRVANVPYDAPAPATPHEERRVLDGERFAAFPGRIQETLSGLVDQPLVGRLWEPLDAVLSRGLNLGGTLSELRHRMEIDWGSRTIEAPISRLCDGEGFRSFVAELLLRSGDVRRNYNEALADYRSAHKIRNAAQPLPDLACVEGWDESPLWVWSVERPTRRSLFVRRESDRVIVTDRAAWTAEGPTDPSALADWLHDLRAGGVKIRSRALVTTLFGRLAVADLFLHGIGGAKYDQVTDGFCQRLFGVVPPPHATLSATVRLPIKHNASANDVRLSQRLLRDLRYHPERFATDHPAAAEKRRLIRAEKTPENAAARHTAFASLNRQLHEALAADIAGAESRVDQAFDQRRTAAVLDSREYSFCLYPESDLRERIRALARFADG